MRNGGDLRLGALRSHLAGVQAKCDESCAANSIRHQNAKGEGGEGCANQHQGIDGVLHRPRDSPEARGELARSLIRSMSFLAEKRAD